MATRLADGALHHVQRVDVGGALPDRADLCVAHQARGHPFLDVADAAADLEGGTGDRDVVAAGAELVDRCEDAQQVRGILVALVRAAHRVGREGVHRQRLLGRQHDLHELPAQQRIFRRGFAEGAAAARGGQRLVEAAAHHRGGAHAMAQPRQVDLAHHLLEAMVHVADQIGGGAVEHDLTRRHGARAELVLQPHDPVAVARAVLETPRQGEHREPPGARRRAARAREDQRQVGVGMAAEPFLTVDFPALDAVGADADALGLGLQRADVGAAGLLRHQLRALHHAGRVLAQQPVHQEVLQLGRGVRLHGEVRRVRHRDRAHQAEFALHEEIGEGVLHQRVCRLRQAEHAGAMAHRVQAEFLVGDLLHLAIGGVVVDPVLVAAEPVARLQHRRMLVGDHREFVEAAAGQLAQPLEMRRHLRAQAGLHVEPQQVLELPVDRIEVLPVDVGGDVVRAVRLPVRVVSHVGHVFLRLFFSRYRQPCFRTRAT